MPVTREARTFWWDAGRPADAAIEPLKAVIFDLDGALTEDFLFEVPVLDADVMPRAGLDELVNSLFFAGISVAVVSTGSRRWAQPLVRQLIGEGIAETIVTPDDLPHPGREPDLHGHALWELGLGPESALAVVGTKRGFRAATAAKLPTLVLAPGDGEDFPGAVEVRKDYDGLLGQGCEQLHHRWQFRNAG
ncbi:HAD family hydrolase [Mycobacterium sp. URHB0044]|uniref:HAD family hydrolase n=1 Tax=Mycobacterium sp. URHB0044 TaxID=1380386 RepID=UPI00056CFD65|nr:HAD family hydrolase [Mycobacterium sp. URHB0044]